MAPVNFARLLAIFSLAILNISFDTLPANALSVDRGHMARGISHAHAGVAKKRGDSPKQCKPRPTVPTTSIKPDVSFSSTSAHSYDTPAPVSHASPQTTTSSILPQSSSAPSSSGPSYGTKAGLAWSNNEETSLCNFIGSGNRPVYNWQLDIYASGDIGNCNKFSPSQFIPTIHGAAQVSQINSIIKSGYPKLVKYLNEPNIASQANLSPQAGYSLFMQYMASHCGTTFECLLPAVTTDATGLKWLQDFVGLCKDCNFLALDLHYYGLDPLDLEKALTLFYNTFQSKWAVWLTEFGCVDYSGQNKPCDEQTFKTFFYTARDFLEKTSWIEHYFYFGLFRSDELPDGVPAINSLMTCPNGPGPSCVPNSNGYAYLNS